ncbi:isoleucine--tRNA ligase, partial [Buchnera aphidicola (Hormaphis cornu)]
FVRWIAPILSFTADEIWDYIPGKKNKYVFSEEWFYPLFSFSQSDILNAEHWKKLILLKSEVNKILERSIKNKLILNSLNACLTLYVNSDLYEILQILGEEIKFMFITSKVTIKNYTDAPSHTYKITSPSISKIEIQFSKKEKCIRCWHYVLKKQKKQTNIKYKKICDRCIKNTSGMGEKRLFL